MRTLNLLTLILIALAGCGGGGGGAPSSAGVAPPVRLTGPDSLANICTDDGQKTWVRAHLDDVYLWYRDIVNVPPGQYTSVQAYFDALLVRPKDRFSFSASQDSIDQFSAAGQLVGYGASFMRDGDRLRVAYTEPGSPAAQNGLLRGAEIVAINGTPRLQLSDAVRLAALYPDSVGALNQFDLLDPGASSTRSVTLQAATVTAAPVQFSDIVTTADHKQVGYLSFTDHIATAEAPLIAAMARFQQAGIDELVLDVRYNGGGYIYIAQGLAAMIGGAATQGKVFEQLTYNDKHPEKTNDPSSTFRFLASGSSGQTLPQLNLKRVFVLTGADTCSASESIINSLTPFLQVVTIGATTCGKPYGFIQKNNCGSAYFAIEFSGVNAQGKGGYVDGFAPTCAAQDDLDHRLGDIHERLFAGALSYAGSGACAPTAQARRSVSAVQLLSREPWRSNRIVQ